MKTKIFTLAILSILSMVILLSGVSAAITLSPTSYTASINKGASSSFNFNIYNDGTSPGFNYTLVNITSIVSSLTGSAGTILSSQVSIGTLPTSIANQTNSSNIAVTITIPSTQANGTYSGTITIAGVNNETSSAVASKTIALTITVTSDDPEEIQSCTTTGNSLGNLEINKIKFSNEGISGTNFGDDEEWYSLSDVDVTVEIKNRGEEKIEDVEVSWGLWDASANQWTIEPIDEDKFDIKSGKDETITFRVNLENDLDIDIDELDDGDYEFYVFAYGYDNENESDICTSDYKDISVVVESDFVVLDNINVQDLIECGSDVQITADVWNIGDRDQDDAYVKIFNSELGINKRVDFSTIDMFDKEPLDVMISIPDSAVEKTYYLRFDVYDDNEDIFESNSDDSSFLVPVLVQGNCASSIGSATVSASLDSEAKAGQPLTVRTTISNSGTASATYTINSAGYASWANSATVDISTFTIGAGESKQVTITLGVKDDASGEQTFNIEVLSGGQLIKTQPVAVTIAGKSAFSSITGGAIGGNGLIWGIGIINVILIIVIIIVAIKVARK